jgi:hypothetical protein
MASTEGRAAVEFPLLSKKSLISKDMLKWDQEREAAIRSSTAADVLKEISYFIDGSFFTINAALNRDISSARNTEMTPGVENSRSWNQHRHSDSVSVEGFHEDIWACHLRSSGMDFCSRLPNSIDLYLETIHYLSKRLATGRFQGLPLALSNIPST